MSEYEVVSPWPIIVSGGTYSEVSADTNGLHIIIIIINWKAVIQDLEISAIISIL